MLLRSSVRESSLHIFLMSVWAKWLFSFINRSHCISSTHPVDLLPFAFVWIFETMNGYRSPALNAGHAFIYPLSKPSFVLVQKKYSQLWALFHFVIWFAELWLHLKVMPQVRSHCVCCAVSLCLVSLTASVWDWCFRRQTCVLPVTLCLQSLPTKSLHTAYIAHKAQVR